MALGDGLGNHAGKALECPLVHTARSDVYTLKKRDDLGVGGAIDDIEVVDARGLVNIMAVGYANIVVDVYKRQLLHEAHIRAHVGIICATNGNMRSAKGHICDGYMMQKRTIGRIPCLLYTSRCV